MAQASTFDLDDESLVSNQAKKPVVYMIDPLHSDAVEYAKTLFNVILPSDGECSNWRQNAISILVRGSHVTADDIERAPKLIAIGKQGVGIDKIDHQACAARRIRILNTPGANSQAVAELVLALTMSVARQIRLIAIRQISEQAVVRDSCSGLTLHKKTIGILGMGNIGRKVAEIFRGAFKADIVAYDPFVPANAWPETPHKRASTVLEVITTADVLTIHVPLTPETRGLISYKELQSMKRTAILINAARGGIVDEEDLRRGLAEGLIWGAGLDCHEQEPPSKQKYEALWENLNVISTPHIGAATSDTQFMTAKAAIDNLYDYLQSVS